MKGKVVFELANVGSKSEGIHPFLIMEDGKKVKLALLGDNPFMHVGLKAYNEKNVILEGEFNENGKFIATSIKEDTPQEPSEVKEAAPVETEKRHIKTVSFETETCEEETTEEACEECCCEKESCEETCECKEECAQEPCEEKPCCCEEEACEETSCCCEKDSCEEE